MQKYCFILFLLFVRICSAQTNSNLVGTYVNIVQQIIKNSDGCCTSIEVLKLHAGNRFSFYAKNDQGDYEVEAFCKGIYKIIGDSVSFVQDKIGMEDFGFSGNKFRVTSWGLQKHDRGPAGGEPIAMKYKKSNLEQFDSMKFHFIQPDTSGFTNETVLVTADRITYAFSKEFWKKPAIKSFKQIDITQSMKEKFLTQLNELDWFETTSGNHKPHIDDTTIEVSFYSKHEKWKWYSKIFSKKLQSFLLEELINTEQ
jgi:hypothetical protein